MAGEPADENVHGFDLVPVDAVEFGGPHGFGVEDVFDGEVETAVAAEQRPDLESRRLVLLVVHEGSE